MDDSLQFGLALCHLLCSVVFLYLFLHTLLGNTGTMSNIWIKNASSSCLDYMVFMVKWTCTSRLSLKAFDQNHCSKLLNIYSRAPKKSELNSSGAPWVYIQFGYLSKNTIIYNNRMMSQYSAHFILTLRLFRLFIDWSITLYWCLLVSLFKVCFGFFPHQRMPFEANRSQCGLAAQADVFAEGLSLFGLIFYFWSSMICVCVKEGQKKTT